MGFGSGGGGGGSSSLSISTATTSDELSPSSTSMSGGVSSSASGSFPASPPTPDTLERGELEQQLQPMQPYTRKTSVKHKDGGSNNINGTTRRIKSPASSAQQKQYNILIKYGSLLLLVGQMVGLVLLMRYSRTHTNGDELYLASTAVFMMEVSEHEVGRGKMAPLRLGVIVFEGPCFCSTCLLIVGKGLQIAN